VDRAMHFGLGLMEERVRRAGGVLQIASERDSGTKITAKFPKRELTGNSVPQSL
jgi:signal transduction histidine kinase